VISGGFSWRGLETFVNGRISHGGIGEINLISLDPKNNPVPTKLNNLNEPPFKRSAVCGALLRPTGSTSSKKEVHVWNSRSCFRYSTKEDKWLKSSGPIEISCNSAYAFHPKTDRLYLTSTLYGHRTASFTEDGSIFHSLPKVRQEINSHVMTVLKGGNVFVSKDERYKTCFLYDNHTNSWKKCPDMNTERDGASCGSIKRSDGSEEVVVVGGYLSRVIVDTVQIFNLDKESWRSGILVNSSCVMNYYSNVSHKGSWV
jgi:hypothetical protein